MKPAGDRPMPALPNEVTEVLLRWSSGDQNAIEELIPLVHAELRRLARMYMARERSGHTFQTCDWINEAYLRLVNQQSVDWQDRAHFFAVAAQVMRRILIDHARSYQYAKRGAGATKIPLDEVAVVNQERASELVALDEALVSLAAYDARKSQIVELRFFGGLSIEETAEVLKISPATVKRELQAARLWLHRMMTENESSQASILS
jgi:RNA polymerase sigma factor (TIGR02999 family)